MKLNQLQFLVELKKYGTISKTAEKLYISQPSLSAAIKELEEELGFEIIIRTRKGVIFTTRGELVLEHSLNVQKEINEIKQLGLSQAGTLQGTLSIGSVPYICHTLILDALMKVKEKYPDMVTNLREESSYDIIKMVVQREIDLGIVMVSNIEEDFFKEQCQKNNLQFDLLFEDEQCFSVGEQHELYQKKKVTMEEALQFPFLTYRNILNDFNRDMLLKYNKDLEFIHIDNKESFTKYLVNSQVITAMPTCAIEEDKRNGHKIKALKIEDFSWNMKLGIVYPKDELLFVEQKEFIDKLFELLKKKK